MSKIIPNSTPQSASKALEMFINTFNTCFFTKYRPTPNRLTLIRKRLKTFTLDDLLLSILNISESQWHRGQNERGWSASPDFLLRNDEQIDRFLNFKPKSISKWSTTGHFS